MRKPVWALSLLPPALSLLTLRIYLGYFDNASLFTENISIASILNDVFIFLTLTFTLILFTFAALCFYCGIYSKRIAGHS
ncbi:hypothetical protein ACP3P6_00305 [Enterobacter mori]